MHCFEPWSYSPFLPLFGKLRLWENKWLALIFLTKPEKRPAPRFHSTSELEMNSSRLLIVFLFCFVFLLNFKLCGKMMRVYGASCAFTGLVDTFIISLFGSAWKLYASAEECWLVSSGKVLRSNALVLKHRSGFESQHLESKIHWLLWTKVIFVMNKGKKPTHAWETCCSKATPAIWDQDWKWLL